MMLTCTCNRDKDGPTPPRASSCQRQGSTWAPGHLGTWTPTGQGPRSSPASNCGAAVAPASRREEPWKPSLDRKGMHDGCNWTRVWQLYPSDSLDKSHPMQLCFSESARGWLTPGPCSSASGSSRPRGIGTLVQPPASILHVIPGIQLEA